MPKGSIIFILSSALFCPETIFKKWCICIIISLKKKMVYSIPFIYSLFFKFPLIHLTTNYFICLFELSVHQMPCLFISQLLSILFLSSTLSIPLSVNYIYNYWYLCIDCNMYLSISFCYCWCLCIISCIIIFLFLFIFVYKISYIRLSILCYCLFYVDGRSEWCKI